MEALKIRLLGEGLRGWQAAAARPLGTEGAELAGGFPAPASAAASRPTPLPPRRSDLPYLSGRRVNTPDDERMAPNCNEFLLSGWEHPKRGRRFSWKKFQTQKRECETLDFKEVWNRTGDIIFLINLK